MLLADVNVFLYAHRPESPRHEEHRAWLSQALTGREPFGVSESVLASYLRIATHHRVYVEPTPLDVALDFCEAVITAPAAVRVRPGPDHWSLFSSLAREASARGNLVPGAYLAALAIEHSATWITTDRGFARFPGLRWRSPLS
jgi:toxin-antitoxin system PIN domain toxin